MCPYLFMKNRLAETLIKISRPDLGNILLNRWRFSQSGRLAAGQFAAMVRPLDWAFVLFSKMSGLIVDFAFL